jgi:hypothetical protein
MNAVDDLPLRDIHLPEPVSWWPPAPGWWLIIVLLMFVVVLAVILRHRHLRKAQQRAARSALHEIGEAYRRSGDAQMLTRQLSVWLRRVVMTQYPRQQVAGLTGAAWLRLLDRTLPGDEFQTGVGQVFLEAPYSLDVRVDGPALLRLCERWMHRFFKKKRAGM